MNANPFTLGHQYLLEQAASRVDRLFIIPVREDRQCFPYAERLAMIKAGAPSGLTVLEGSDYQISAATFPTYFLKDLSDAAETQMRLDLDLFSKHIAPALGASVRFVGAEPSDALTARYNEIMKEVLPEVVEIPRLETGHPISASSVRKFLEQGSFTCASALCPKSTRPYLLGYLADRALRMELDTPLKPGLVGPDSCGAHKDMDYGVMLRGIEALPQDGTGPESAGTARTGDRGRKGYAGGHRWGEYAPGGYLLPGPGAECVWNGSPCE